MTEVQRIGDLVRIEFLKIMSPRMLWGLVCLNIAMLFLGSILFFNLYTIQREHAAYLVLLGNKVAAFEERAKISGRFDLLEELILQIHEEQ